MQYCKYHPLRPATYVCRQCVVNSCNDCVNDSVELAAARCFNCGKELESYGASYGAVPFWRRLEQSFRYPLNRQTLIFISVISLLTTLVSLLPIGELVKLPILVLLMGALLKYCFTCLEKTAMGHMVAPSVQGAYEGGVSLILRLLGMVILLLIGLYGFNYFFGATITSLLSLIFLLGIPAILINYALNDDVFEAVNPLNILNLISRIGLPYGLLMAFIFVMFASVNVIYEIIGTHVWFLSAALQSITSSYYMVVIFHIMGYVIFQYQGRLGFIASQIDDYMEDRRQGHELYHAHIEIALKEGMFGQAYELFDEAVRRFPSDTSFYDKLFELVCYGKDANRINQFGEKYLSTQQRLGRPDKLMSGYKKIITIVPEFELESAELRYQLSCDFQAKGDSVAVVKLLNGLLSRSPNYAKLYDAYQVLSQALESIPGMEENASQCRLLLDKLKQAPVGATSAKKIEGKATFNVIDKPPEFDVPNNDDKDKKVNKGRPLDFK